MSDYSNMKEDILEDVKDELDTDEDVIELLESARADERGRREEFYLNELKVELNKQMKAYKEQYKEVKKK